MHPSMLSQNTYKRISKYTKASGADADVLPYKYFAFAYTIYFTDHMCQLCFFAF